jgi:hypothetical protein
MDKWNDLLTAEEQQVYEVFRQPKTLGLRPAILVIDVNYAFVGASLSTSSGSAGLAPRGARLGGCQYSAPC